MCPELFRIPFTDLTIKSYGLMLVIGFLVAVYLIRRLSRDITPNPQLITNAALYSLIAGVVGARVFYVVHYFSQFRSNLFSVFAIWQGGLELLGGVISAVGVIVLYLRYHKLPIRRYLDILVIGLFAALALGRVGCFLNGCCFGKPTNSPLAVRFPYASPAYRSQTSADLARGRSQPHLELPSDFFNYFERQGSEFQQLKPFDQLTWEQRVLVQNGTCRCLPVHPTQLYSSANALLCCFILYFFWRRSRSLEKSGKTSLAFVKPGCTFGLMFVLYGITRFFLEFLRDDNPFEFDRLTVSQNISVLMIISGTALLIVFSKIKTKKDLDQC